MSADPMRNTYRAFIGLVLLTLLAMLFGYQIGRALALEDNQRPNLPAEGDSARPGTPAFEVER